MTKGPRGRRDAPGLQRPTPKTRMSTESDSSAQTEIDALKEIAEKKTWRVLANLYLLVRRIPVITAINRLEKVRRRWEKIARHDGSGASSMQKTIRTPKPRRDDPCFVGNPSQRAKTAQTFPTTGR